MKIALLIDSLVAGGAQRQMVVLANGLADSGHDVHLFFYHDKTQLMRDLNDTRIDTTMIRRNGKIDFLFLYRLTAALRRRRPDVLISFLSGPNFWARVAGMMTRVNTVVTSERSIDLGDSKIKTVLEKAMSPLSTYIVVNTHTARDYFVKSLGISAVKMRVIPNGVDTGRFRRQDTTERARFRQKFGINETEFVIVLPGRIDKAKNHSCLIEAITLLRNTDKEIRTLFFGNEFDQDLKRELSEKIASLGLSDRILFCGYHQNMPAVYNMADLVVLPSLWEGLPNVVLEAMACQTPVIVSDISDNRMIVSENETGYLFRSNDARDLAVKISRFNELSQSQKREMGRAARQKIQKTFSMSLFLKAYAKLIE